MTPDYAVVWDGRRGLAAPILEATLKPFLVFDPPARPKRRRRTPAELALANRAGGKVRRAHTRIWAQLAHPVTTRQLMTRLGLPLHPVSTLLCKAVRAGVVVVVDVEPGTGRRRYQRAPAKAQAFHFPAIGRYQR